MRGQGAKGQAKPAEVTEVDKLMRAATISEEHLCSTGRSVACSLMLSSSKRRSSESSNSSSRSSDDTRGEGLTHDPSEDPDQ